MYATPDQVRAVLTRDTAAPEGTAAELDDAVLSQAIGSAGSQVDAALAARYRVPFDSPPELVVDVTVAIAAYLADLTHRQSVDISDNDPVYRRYVWANGVLTALSKGTSDLPGGGDGTEAARGSVPINPYTGRLFGLGDFGLGYGSTRDHYCYPWRP